MGPVSVIKKLVGCGNLGHGSGFPGERAVGRFWRGGNVCWCKAENTRTFCPSTTPPLAQTVVLIHRIARSGYISGF